MRQRLSASPWIRISTSRRDDDLRRLVAGDHVFLDVNISVYHFGPHHTLGAACNQLVQRIENRELSGSTSTHVLSEVADRSMLFEASNLPGWSLTGVKGRLQKKPDGSGPVSVSSGSRERAAVPS